MAWDTVDGKLVKVVKKKDFREAMAFVNAVADVAEAANHHPDIAISWNEVTLTLWTHTEGGITDADRQMSERIDGIGT
jgi:4a-hydroxytetrahydrobiopterin dehydratase